MKDEQWVHAANGQVDCYNAAMYVGYVATPKEQEVAAAAPAAVKAPKVVVKTVGAEERHYECGGYFFKAVKEERYAPAARGMTVGYTIWHMWRVDAAGAVVHDYLFGPSKLYEVKETVVSEVQRLNEKAAAAAN